MDHLNLTNLRSSQEQLNKSKHDLLDPLALKLIDKVKWKYLEKFSTTKSDLYPVAITGKGPPILMLHGFDSSFLEFRRLVPLLSNRNKLIIPDLYGFGFCPRPKKNNYGLESIVSHLTEILKASSINGEIGVIGASMGGSVALEIARRNHKIKKLLLLSPAGICTKTKKIPWPLNQLGVLFLKQPYIRKSLCRQAFANPQKNVGAAEEQIASIHLNVPGWHRSLALFAGNGGISNSERSIPSQPLNVLWGEKDRILNSKERQKTMFFLQKELNEIKDCGHLPHIDKPEIVAKYCKDF